MITGTNYEDRMRIVQETLAWDIEYIETNTQCEIQLKSQYEVCTVVDNVCTKFLEIGITEFMPFGVECCMVDCSQREDLYINVMKAEWIMGALLSVQSTKRNIYTNSWVAQERTIYNKSFEKYGMDMQKIGAV